MVISGAAVLAIVRPWRADPPDERPSPGRNRQPIQRPRPRPAVRRHRVETITRTRRVPPEPGREEILLPEWLGPVTPERLERKRALAD